MKIRNLLLAGSAAAVLAVGASAPAPANDIKKFEGTIAAPLPVLSNMLAGEYETDAARQTCPDPGAGDGVNYKFFDLKGEFKFFFVSGPPSTLSEPDPSGQGLGTFHDYDLDAYAFDAKCTLLEADGSINTLNGIGDLMTRKPARFIAVSYHHGIHPNIDVTVEASNTKIKK